MKQLLFGKFQESLFQAAYQALGSDGDSYDDVESWDVDLRDIYQQIYHPISREVIAEYMLVDIREHAARYPYWERGNYSDFVAAWLRTRCGGRRLSRHRMRHLDYQIMAATKTKRWYEK